MNSIQEKLETAIRQHQSGMLGEAEQIYRSVVRIDPAQADAWHLLGVVKHQKGDQQEAEECINRAIEIAPNSAAFHSNLASVYKMSNRLDAAKESLERAVSIDKNFVDAFYNLGTICKELKQYPQAIRALETALSIDPANAHANNNLGTVYAEMKDYEKAKDNYSKAISQQPKFSEAINNLGLVYAAQNNDNKAKECFEHAYRCQTDDVEPLLNLANMLRKEGKISQAEELYRQSRVIEPQNIGVLNNLGVTLKDQGKYDEALDLFEEVLAEDPEHIEALINRSFVHRLKGNLERGWRDFDWWFRADENSRTFSGPRWDGSSLTGKTILIHAEQGIGDQIMFASCVGEIVTEAKRVVLECDPRLVPLFQRSFPHAQVVPESEQNHSLCYDFQSPMGSLLQHRRPNWESFPQENRFLKSDENAVQKWYERFNALTGKLKVGISWRGGLDPEVARQRTIDFEDWKPLFEISEICFVNLQYGVDRAELDRIEKEHHLCLHDWDDSDPLRDLDDFAAKIAALDLVISIDNSTVHFAGGLEIPCWILLPYVPDWRWFLDREDSPWYRSVKLFRQQIAGEWNEVFENVRKAVREKIQERDDRYSARPKTEVFRFGRARLLPSRNPADARGSAGASPSQKPQFVTERGISVVNAQNKTENMWHVSPDDLEWLEANISLRWHPAITTLEDSRRAFPESRYHFAKEYCQGKKVLDAGCGSGFGSVILSETAENVTAIDFCEKAVGFAQRNHGSATRTFHRSPLENTPFEDSAFDVVVCFECIEHLISPRAGLREIARLVNEDGLTIISVPNNWGLTKHHFCDPNFEYLKTMTGDFFEETEFFYNNSGTDTSCLPEGIGPLHEIGPERAECLIAVCRQPKKVDVTDRVNTLLEEIYESAFTRHREFLDSRKSSYGNLPEIDNQEPHPSVQVGTKIELQSDSIQSDVSQIVLRFPLNMEPLNNGVFKVDLPKIDLAKPVLGQLHIVMENGEIGQSPVIRLVTQ